MPIKHKDGRIEMEEQPLLVQKVWLIIGGLVLVGLVVNIFLPGGLVIWPFVFAVSVLLIINDETDRSEPGIPPLQAYGLFAGTLVAFFLFIAIVATTVNHWLLIGLVIAVGTWLGRDWRERKKKQKLIDVRRLNGLCIRCGYPVGDDIDERCKNCDQLVNPERLNLFRLTGSIASRARPEYTRAVLTGQTPKKADLKLKSLQQQRRAAKFGGRKK